MRNQVQLITYADRLSGGSLAELEALLTGPLAGVFGGVHILPFYDPIDGADAGFDPIDHLRVDPRLGDWAQIKSLAATFDVVADVIVNHMSSDSPQFKDFSRKGQASEFDGLFLTRDAVFPDGVTDAARAAIYRPRPGSPFTTMVLENGETRVLWTTFTPKQIDIDVLHPLGRAYLDSILCKLAANGVRLIRLDAVGYAIKKPGTSCFMLPETFDFIDRFSERAHSLGLEVLVEIHSHYRKQVEIAKHVDWVYDFALPPLMLHALIYRTARHLKKWIVMRPNNALTVLDTHDGIGIIDVGADPADPVACPGLIPAAELDHVVDRIHANCLGQSREATGTAASNLDLYQVNCTFYDALGRDEDAYLLARAVQFFLPGVPQVYYVGLLGGRNDMDLLRRTGVGRDINRHWYSEAEVNEATQFPVVRRLVDLIRLRNEHPAFAGVFSLEQSVEDSRLEMSWVSGSEWIKLSVDFATRSFQIERST